MGGDCAVDLEKTIMPVSVAGGIYDFSGTQASHCYAESNITCSKDEVSSWTKSWWDGSSDGWLADGDFNALMKDYKVTIDVRLEDGRRHWPLRLPLRCCCVRRGQGYRRRLLRHGCVLPHGGIQGGRILSLLKRRCSCNMNIRWLSSSP